MDLLGESSLILARLSAAISGPLGDLAAWLDWPLASALLFGLIGAAAPCQVTTNLSAIAYVARAGARGPMVRDTLAFIAGKCVVYALLGIAAIALGSALQAAAIPAAMTIRKVLGPVLMVVGLSMLGLFRLRGGAGVTLADRLGRRLPRSGALGAVALGATLGLGFCPTLFWLFFGLTVPLVMTSAAGPVLPVLFALGTAAPVLALTGIVAAVRPADPRAALARAGAIMHPVAGGVLFLLGVRDTLLYWVV